MNDPNLVVSPVNSRAAFEALIKSARKTLLIEAEEMQDSDIEQAIVSAGQRGVQVKEDPRLYMHAKMMLADGQRAFVGSENISTASLERNRELGIFVSDRERIEYAAANIPAGLERLTIGPVTTRESSAREGAAIAVFLYIMIGLERSKIGGILMVTEIAVFIAVPGKEDELGQAIIRGLEVIRQHPGCISSHVTRCIEQPGRYMLANVWTSLEAHTVDFRGGPLFSQWRGHISGLFEGNPEVFHYQAY